MNKRDQLNSVVSSTNADLILLTETWLSKHVCSSEIFQGDKTYNVYRFDRDGRHGGGTLIAVSQSIPSFCVDVASDLEMVWACITLNNTRILLGVCYRPPNSAVTFIDDLHDVMNSIVCQYPSSPIFLLGDFNFPVIMWSDPPSSQQVSTQSQHFLNLCACFNLTQLVTKPTRYANDTANILDLILSTHPDLLSSLTYLPGLSDHSLLNFDLKVAPPINIKKVKLISDYNKANFDLINQKLCSYLDIYLPQFDQRSVQENWRLFCLKVNELIDAHVPVRRIQSDAKAPWYTNTLKRLSNKKQRLFRLAKLRNTIDRWEAYFAAEVEYSQAVSDVKEIFFKNTLPSLLLNDPKKFWKTVNMNDDALISLSDESGALIPPAEYPSVFNNVFSNSFSVGDGNVFYDVPRCEFSPMFPISMEPAGIVKLIDSLKVSSSCGSDNINSKFLRQTKMYSSFFFG